MARSLLDRLIALVTHAPPPPPAKPTPDSSQGAVAVEAAAAQIDQALSDLLLSLQDLGRRDRKLMELLESKYSIPQRMASLGDAISAFMAAVQPFLTPKNDPDDTPQSPPR